MNLKNTTTKHTNKTNMKKVKILPMGVRYLKAKKKKKAAKKKPKIMYGYNTCK